MKISLVTETLAIGGTETFVVRLANNLSKIHTVQLVVFYKDMSRQELIDQVVPEVELIFLDIPLPRLLFKVDSLFRKAKLDFSIMHRVVSKRLYSILGIFGPNVVHSHLIKSDLAVCSCNKARLFRHIITLHGDYSSFYAGESIATLFNVKQKIIRNFDQVDSIICICKEQLEFVSTYFPNLLSKSKLIYNGYEARKYPSDRETVNRKYIYGMVSRGVEKKGWLLAIKAFKSIFQSGMELWLIGDGAYLEKLKEDYAQDPSVKFIGFTSDPGKYISQFDVGLLPTQFRYESLPTVVIEYLYHGKPVVATKVGEIPDIIMNDRGELAGCLVELGNVELFIAEFADKMKFLFLEQDFAFQLGKVALEAFSKFDMSECVKKYGEVYVGN